MKSHHYSKLAHFIATGVLIIANLSLAIPVLADSNTRNQVTGKNEWISSETMSGNPQATTVQSKNGQSAATPTTKQQLEEPSQQTNEQASQEVTEQPAGKIAQDIKNGVINNQQLVNHAYQKIEQSNQQLNNVIYVDQANAQQQVEKLKSEDKAGKPFYGVPILIKGLGQAYKGYPNTEGLPYLKDNTYHYTNGFVKKLQKMGFVIIGSTNFPELGLINITNSNLNGVTHNPWDLTRNPGGSSGGASASVAAGIVPIATGNDAGGSLRIPASWSGVIGLKPTQGLITGDSLTPSVVNFADTRSIDDTVSLLKGLMDHKHAQKLLQPLPKDLKTVKIAYSLTSPVGTPVSQDAKNAVLNVVNFLRQQGFNVVEENSPVDGVKMMQAYYLGALDDGSVANFLAQQKLHRNLTAADVTSGLVSPMTYALYEASKKAPKKVKQTFNDELKLVHDQMTAFHNRYPVYLTPTTATVAPLNSDPAYLPEYVEKMLKIKELPFNQQMQLIYDSWLHGLSKTPFTQLANLAGEPALSLPTYVSAAGLPLGIQLEGAKGSDFLLLGLGKLFESHHQLIFLNEYRSHEVTKTKSEQLTVVKANRKILNNFQNVNVMNQDVSTPTDRSIRSNTPNNSEALKIREQRELPQTGSDEEVSFLTPGLVLIVMLGYLEAIKINKQR